MPQSSEAIDRLTQTFSMDQTYCDALLRSSSAEVVAELLIAHGWANVAIPRCFSGLAAAVGKRFEGRADTAAFWNLVFIDGINRDIRLVPYLVLRGLPSEASAALRRALEHMGVLTHIWSDPAKVDALRDTDSEEHKQAFRYEVDRNKAKLLREAKISKRFAAMKFGYGATILYETLSKMEIHGGTSTRFVLHSAEPGPLTCSFVVRPDPTDEQAIRYIHILGDGHRALCGEVMGLCAEFAGRSEELTSVAANFRLLASVTGERSPQLQKHVEEFLKQLGVATPKT